MSLELSTTPPAGVGGFTPQGRRDHLHQQQRMSNSRSSARLDPSPVGHAGGAGCSPEVGAQEQQQRQPSQSAVGAVIAEVVAARRSRESRSSEPQSRGIDMDMDMDMDIDMDVVRRGTPMSDGRQALAQPRLLLSELDGDAAGSPAGEGEGASAAYMDRARGFDDLKHAFSWCWHARVESLLCCCTSVVHGALG